MCLLGAMKALQEATHDATTAREPNVIALDVQLQHSLPV